MQEVYAAPDVGCIDERDDNLCGTQAGQRYGSMERARPHNWGPRRAPWIVLRSRGGPRIMPLITGPRRDGGRRGLPPAAKPRHGPLSCVLQAPPYRHTRDADHGGEAHETSLSNHFRGRGWDPAVSLNEATRETGRAPGREVSLDRHSDQ